MQGVFITFEGPEGAGKSSVCEMISRYFDNILLIREPGATTIGEKIRDMIHHDEMPDISELLLFEAARACLVQTVIKPALESGKIVICDRFYDSTTAYQGYGRGINLDTIKFLNRLASELTPDLTILFDLDPVIGMKRKGKPTDRIESAGMDFHNRVRNGYLQIAKDNPQRFVVVNAEDEQDIVVRNVFQYVQTYSTYRPIGE
jgi:dTMP kinase